MTTTLDELKTDACGELDEHIERQDWSRDETESFLDQPHDTIHEIADSGIPIYNATLLELAANDNELALSEPELGPAFDGTATPINIIAANVFEAIEAALWDRVRELQQNLKEEE